jgi:hypothetical protein
MEDRSKQKQNKIKGQSFSRLKPDQINRLCKSIEHCYKQIKIRKIRKKESNDKKNGEN